MEDATAIGSKMAAIFTAARAAGHVFRRQAPIKITLSFADGGVVRIPIPEEPQDEDAEDRRTFIPTTFQQAILTALRGTALRTDALAKTLRYDRRKLFSRHGISELMDAGLVGNDPSIGYYSTEFPPNSLKN